MKELNKITEKIITKDYIKRYSILAVALFLNSFNYNLFIFPSKFVTGGTTGIALIFNELFGLDPSLVIFLLSFIVLIFSFIYLGKEDTVAAGFIAIVYPLFVKATTGIDQIFLLDASNKLLMAIFGGILGGIGSGIIYKVGLNTGGLGVIIKIIANKNKKSVTKMNMIINTIIVLIGGFIFGANMVLYACLILYISNMMSEKLLLGMSRNKTFYIISNKEKQITSFIMDELHHDVTTFNTKGKFLEKNQKLIMSVIPTSEYFLLKQAIKDIDDKAFVTITDSYEAKGQDVKIGEAKPKKENIFSRLFKNNMV